MMQPLYPTHIPLSPLQKGALAVLAAAGALARPARADLVATVGETSAVWVLDRLRQRMLADESGREVLRERPLVTDASTSACWDMPPHTFGGAYACFMGDRGFHADDRPPVRFIDDAELAYIIRRMREVHDFWHVLFGLHTNVFGEISLKALEFVQTGMPMPGLAVLGAQWRLNSNDRALLHAEYLPWAMRAGNRCTDLMSVYYERHFEDDLDELRKRLRIIPAPSPPSHLGFQKKAGTASTPGTGDGSRLATVAESRTTPHPGAASGAA